MSDKEKIISLIKQDDEAGLSNFLKENSGSLHDITSMRSIDDKTIIQIAVENDNIDIVKKLCRFVYKKEDLSNTGVIGKKLSGSMDKIVE